MALRESACTGRALEWANPGGATLTREDLAVMTAGYYGMVAQLDYAIGRVLDVLDERGLADDTLVMITTDHGEFLGEHQMIFKGPFGYDSLLRVPLLVRGSNIPAGNVVDDPVYLQLPFQTAIHYKLERDTSKWDPTPCDARF